MPVFEFSGVNVSGTPQSGSVSADSPRSARDQLRQTGLRITSLSEVQSRSTWKLALPAFLQPKYTTAATALIRELATLLRVGVPLVECLATILKQHPRGSFRLVLLNLEDRIREGQSLAAAFAEHPRIFSPVAQALVEVGERAGRLDAVLGHLADFQERVGQLRDKVTTALLYPIVVLCCAVVVSLFLMTFVIPMLLEGLIQAGKPLPWPTQLLKTVSDTLTTHGLALAGVAILSIIGAMAWSRTQSGRRTIDRTLLKLPVVGELVLQQSLSRLALVLSVLLRGGIEFLPALAIAAKGVGNTALESAFEECGQAVSEGMDLGPALERTQIFPPVVVQIFAVGQQSGQLDGLLERLAADYDQRASTQAGRLATLLEPVLIIGLSVIVGFILFATILPILEAGNVM